MRIFFAGTTEHAAKMLHAIHAAGHEIVGVLTREDSRVGRRGVPSPSPVAKSAIDLQFPLFKANAVNDELSEAISKLNPELGFVLAYGSILKTKVLEIPVYGWVNLHFSLLPRYRGASPVQHAILDGVTHTGVTLFSLDSGIDTGPILSSATFELSGQENSKQALEQLTEVGIRLSLETLDNFHDRFSKRYAQSSSGASFTGKITRADAKLDFHKSAIQLHNIIRAMNPEPMAWFEYSATPIRVLEASVAELELPVGEAKLIERRVHVGCGDNSLELLRVQPAGKSVMNASDWFRGLREETLFLV